MFINLFQNKKRKKKKKKKEALNIESYYANPEACWYCPSEYRSADLPLIQLFLHFCISEWHKTTSSYILQDFLQIERIVSRIFILRSFAVNSEFTQQGGRMKRAAKRFCVTNVTAGNWEIIPPPTCEFFLWVFFLLTSKF